MFVFGEAVQTRQVRCRTSHGLPTLVPMLYACDLRFLHLLLSASSIVPRILVSSICVVVSRPLGLEIVNAFR